MNTSYIAVLSIAMSVAAQFSLKAGMSSDGTQKLLSELPTVRAGFAVLTNPYVLAGLFLYGLGALAWLAVLSKWDVSKAYPLVGLGFIFTAAIGYMIGEQVTIPRATGIALICTGVFLVGRS